MTATSHTHSETPRRASAIGMWLFLAALGMLFVSSMGLYVLMRLQVFGHASNERVNLPPYTWLSTAVLLGASVAIHCAVANVRLERLVKFRKYLYAATALAVLFLGIQFPCMWTLLEQHLAAAAQLAASGGTGVMPLKGLVFFLIVLHAMHVVGGIVAMGVVIVHARQGRYDHENYAGVRHTALYWHFLDVVWLVMFTIFKVMA